MDTRESRELCRAVRNGWLDVEDRASRIEDEVEPLLQSNEDGELGSKRAEHRERAERVKTPVGTPGAGFFSQTLAGRTHGTVNTELNPHQHIDAAECLAHGSSEAAADYSRCV